MIDVPDSADSAWLERPLAFAAANASHVRSPIRSASNWAPGPNTEKLLSIGRAEKLSDI